MASMSAKTEERKTAVGSAKPGVVTRDQVALMASPARSRRSSGGLCTPKASPAREIGKVREETQVKTPTPETASTPIKAQQGNRQGAFPILVHVYDLGPVSRFLVNSWALNVRDQSCLGVFHCGVEVLGVEFSFQAMADCGEEDEITGLTWHNPKSHPRHVYRETVDLGMCYMTVGEVSKLLERLEKVWLARHYHCLSNNCVDFAEHFSSCLQAPRPFPEWVHGLAKNLARKDSPLQQRLTLPKCLGSCGSCASSGSKSIGSSSCGSCSSFGRLQERAKDAAVVEDAAEAPVMVESQSSRPVGCSLFGIM